MAKKDVDKFLKWADEFKSKLPENLHTSWQALLNHENAVQELSDGYSRTDDYTRKTQEISRTREELDAAKAAFENEKSQQMNWYTQANQEYQAAVGELQRLRAGQTQTTPAPSGAEAAIAAKIARLEAHLQAIDSGTRTAFETLPDLAYRAAKEGYDFNSAKVLETSQRLNIPIPDAYERLIASERAERAQKEMEKKLEEARESGRREALSKQPSPDAFGANAPSLSWEKAPVLSNEDERLSAAYKTFTDAGQTS